MPPASPTHYHVLLPHAHEPRLLLVPGADGWALPHWTTTEPHMRHTVGHIRETMERLFGVETTVLRRVREERDPITGQAERFYALENLSRDWPPPAGGAWFDAAGIERATLAVPEHRQLLRTWFEEWENPPARRVPWAHPGWSVKAGAWMREELARAGIPLVGPVEQVRTWQRSCILRVSTVSGEAYLKAVPHWLAAEPPLTQALAGRHPRHLPRVIAIDRDRRWLLMEGVRGETLDHSPSLPDWASALSVYAQMQIAETAQVDHSLALGCPDRRLDRLAADIELLLADPVVLQPGQEHGLNEDEIARLRALAPRLVEACAELSGYEIPLTLEHGDFYAWQVLVSGEVAVFIDWSDSSVAHPFFSLFLFFQFAELERWLAAAPEARTHLQDAYLEPWSFCAPIERLRATLNLALALAPLHHAALYQQRILPHLEDPWEWEAMAPWFLKLALASAPSP